MSAVFMWAIFAFAIVAMLVADFTLFSGKDREKEVGIKEALLWSLFWIVLAFIFNAGIFLFGTHERGINFLTGYLIERALSMDNIFVFLLIFNYFRVPGPFHQAVLFWGILFALVLRVIFIAVGVVLINTFHWMVFILGAFLVFVGIKMLFAGDKEQDLSKNQVLLFIRKVVPLTNDYYKKKFLVREASGLKATPLFVVFLMVAAMDIVFAVDSIPAILAITTDPFVVYTSNIFAILGLRALYSAIAALADVFHYLNVGLSFILVFIGLKMVLSDVIHFSVVWTLVIVALVLVVSIVASVFLPKARNNG
jgi:tellurite resistance protein TerC